MHNDHFTVRRQSIFLFNADSYKSLNARASSYPTRGQWHPGTQTKSCASRPTVFLQIKVVCPNYLELIIYHKCEYIISIHIELI